MIRRIWMNRARNAQRSILTGLGDGFDSPENLELLQRLFAVAPSVVNEELEASAPPAGPSAPWGCEGRPSDLTPGKAPRGAPDEWLIGLCDRLLDMLKQDEAATWRRQWMACLHSLGWGGRPCGPGLGRALDRLDRPRR